MKELSSFADYAYSAYVQCLSYGSSLGSNPTICQKYKMGTQSKGWPCNTALQPTKKTIQKKKKSRNLKFKKYKMKPYILYTSMAEQTKGFDSCFFHINCHSVLGVLKNCQLKQETFLSKTTFGIVIDSFCVFREVFLRWPDCTAGQRGRSERHCSCCLDGRGRRTLSCYYSLPDVIRC